MNIFKRIPIYIKIYENKIVIHRLDNEKQISGTAQFSDSRIVFAEFDIVESLMNRLISKLIPESNGYFSSSLNILVQQLDKNNPKISTVEKRAILESCERVNGVTVNLIDNLEEISIKKAKEILFDFKN